MQKNEGSPGKVELGAVEVKCDLEGNCTTESEKPEVKIAEKSLEEIYNAAMASMSAMTSSLSGNTARAVNVWFGGIDIVKDLSTHQGENHYEGIGRFVGDALGIIGTIMVQESKWFRGLSVRGKAFGSAALYEGIAHTKQIIGASLGDIGAKAFNTYVAYADRFYEEILTNKDFFNKTLDNLSTNWMKNFSNLFDPDGDGNVSPLDIVNGYKKLFSPPPAYGTADFEMDFVAKKPNNINIKINSSKKEQIQKEAISEIIKYDFIKSVTLNSHTYNIRNLSNLEIRNAIDKIPPVSFLLSDILIRTGEELDLGSKGMYKVKSGDTLSTIAQRNGMVTKELLKLNTWLADEGRVKFLKTMYW